MDIVAATTGGVLGFIGYLVLAIAAIVFGLMWHRNYKKKRAMGSKDEDLVI